MGTLCCISLTDWTNIGTAVGTIALAVIAIVQLPQLVNSSRLGVLMAVFEQENELNVRKIAIDEIAFKIREYFNITQQDFNINQLDILKDRLGIVVENYLNLIDRIAFSIDKNYFPERDWKKEYEKLFKEVYTLYPNKFEEGTSYHNFIEICRRWGIIETKK